MPRKAKTSPKPAADATKSNGISKQQLTDFVTEYEAEVTNIDAIMADAVLACQPHKDQMKEITKAAAEAGVPKKVFKAKLNERRHLRKAEQADHALSDEMKEIYAEVSQKLGDLGMWAKADAEGRA
jgi:uncharacterized protein (UPF0335 family)